MGDGGIQECGYAQNCVEVCPKDIPLTKVDRGSRRPGHEAGNCGSVYYQIIDLWYRIATPLGISQFSVGQRIPL
jgi:hypothetical protein